MTWKATLLTLFPEMFPGPLGHSLAGKALEDQKWSLETLNIRDFATDKHKTVDDTSFGGGTGMVIRPDIVHAALTKATELNPLATKIYLTPRGKPLHRDMVHTYSTGPGVILLCGRYEGVDQRVIEHWAMEEVSIGDFVLSGGEIAALTLLDACIRRLPNVIGKKESFENDSFELGLLEYPQYTKPQVWNNIAVPDVLLSGNHQQIAQWRLQAAEQATQLRRPDLWVRYLEKRGVVNEFTSED